MTKLENMLDIDLTIPATETLDITAAKELNINQEEDKWILNGALNINTGQTKYQSKVFVANSQITQYKAIRQCLMELEVRHHGFIDVKLKLRKHLAEMAVAKREYDKEDDELLKEVIECDIESMEYDKQVWVKKLRNHREEIEYYLELVKELSNNDKEIIKNAFSYNEEDDKEYWIKRMSKQAAMDMVSYSRIGSGNMDSIAMMPEDDQVKVLATTLQYYETLQLGMGKIADEVHNKLEDKSDLLKGFNLPNITDELLIKDEIEHEENIQPAPQPETKSEPI